MRNELRELNRSYQETIKDSKVKYEIKMILKKFFKSALESYEIGKENGVVKYENDKKKIKYLLLEDKDGIIDDKIIPILIQELPYKNIDELLDLVDDFYVEELNKVYKYYQELNKARTNELEEIIYDNFVWSIKNSKLDTKSALDCIRNINYKRQLRKSLSEKDIPLETYNASYDKAFTRFKKSWGNYVNENCNQDAREEKVSFGWKLYAMTKIVEGLFKM